MTPLGPAECVILSPGDDDEWCCWIAATQEVWWFRNPFIRRRRNVSNGFYTSSPFSKINKPLQRQIERYKKNGWLPANYNPEDIETWPL